ncbi:hypothetical protein [Microbacterium sp. nov. GSS16]|uniref:hypothetical protein n=1 Tax=Microbacterium sp. nov. GSS16 TaxID=3019890 RepID=UPI00230665F3|nr:hypothetical protein [Microbacterium sp. nov. GSS16]WCD92894.1 hypothetical protein PGB26_01035 [Microbacterium sp. nov. GSS16]
MSGLFLGTLLMHLPGLSLVPISIFPALFLVFPLVIGTAGRVRTLLCASLIACASGIITLIFSAASGVVTPAFETWGAILLWLLAIPLLLGVAERAFRAVSPRAGVLLMLGGATVSSFFTYHGSWKGSFGIFAMAFVLVLLARHIILALFAAGGGIALSLWADARSMAAAIGASVLIWGVGRLRAHQRLRFKDLLVMFAALGLFAVLSVFVLASGWAGPSAQARTLDQLRRANLLFGFRAEWAITFDLFSAYPAGLGIGAGLPDGVKGDAILAVERAGGDWSADYFQYTVLGDRVDLHSTVANLWFHFGLGGILLAAVLLLLLLGALRSTPMYSRDFGLGGTLMVLLAIWDLFFSPMGDVDRVIAGLVVAMLMSNAGDRGAQVSARDCTELSTASCLETISLSAPANSP